MFGYSMGGYVALAAAHMRPDRVGRVITLGTKFEWTPDVGARGAAWLDPVTIRAKVPPYADALEARHTVSAEESARAAALLANGTAMVLPDTPHPFERVDHALLAAAVINFLTS